jgi:peptide deformylase
MAVLDIVHYPHEALTTPAVRVEHFDDELATFIDDMAETMYAADGVGLAANQVAVLKRVTVIDTADDDGPGLLEIVNPTIVERSDEPILWQEGCLSFPELFFDVKRARRVTVEYFDRHGTPQRIEADGLLAVALQHEIDHLDGVVYIDRIGQVDRRLMLRKYRKLATERASSEA